MADPFMAELRIVSFSFAPKGWALANGQLLPINQNQALFSLLGTTYGGNGQTNFALPDLRGRVPIHMSADFNLGQRGGEEFHTLNTNEMPAHIHSVSCVDNTGNATVPTNALLARTPANLYAPPADFTAMNAATITHTGGTQPHENRQPFLVLNVVIALQGIFPTRN